jgi:signal transduction histidine kinase
MDTLWLLLRRLTVPFILVMITAVLTVPWATLVVRAAYEDEAAVRARLIVEKVRTHLSLSPSWTSRQEAVDRAWDRLQEVHPAIQAIGILDEGRNPPVFHSRNDSIRLPHSLEEANGMLRADPASHRELVPPENWSASRNRIYVDLSNSKLTSRLRGSYPPLLRHVIWLMFAGFAIISSAAVLTYRFWGRAAQQQHRAQLEQQGMLAERVLTAAVLAHEIRNPLAALRFQLHSLRRNASDAVRVTSMADTIDGELMRIQQLVQNYLAHERAQSMHVESVDLAQAARGLHTLMDELMHECGTKLTIAENARNVHVSCDPHALRQVLINLLINAQQAMGHGGSITVSIDREESFGVISVADSGPGIPPEMKDRLFKPFATSKKHGSGIGLALVKRFVDNFGGVVTVDSQPGTGATFRLKLPLAEPASAEKPPESPEQPAQGLDKLNV